MGALGGAFKYPFVDLLDEGEDEEVEPLEKKNEEEEEEGEEDEEVEAGSGEVDAADFCLSTHFLQAIVFLQRFKYVHNLRTSRDDAFEAGSRREMVDKADAINHAGAVGGGVVKGLREFKLLLIKFDVNVVEVISLAFG